MSLTAEQRQLLDAAGPVKPTGDQTYEQAENLAVAGFRAACQFSGLDVPDEAEVREEIRRAI